MAKSILFIIDPIQDLNKEKDTSLLLMRTSIEIGHHVYFCSHTDISLKSNIPHGKIKEIKRTNLDRLPGNNPKIPIKYYFNTIGIDLFRD